VSIRTAADRLRRTLLVSRSEHERALPPVRIEVRASVAARWLHLAGAGLALALASLLVDGALPWAAALAAAAVLAVRPLPGFGVLYGAALGALLALEDGPSYDGRTVLLVLGVHILCGLSIVVQAAPSDTQVELAVLRAAARRMAPVQAAAQLALAGGTWLAGRDMSAVPLTAAAAAGIAALAWWLVLAARAPSRAGRQRVQGERADD
jgi:hypothetical protein